MGAEGITISSVFTSLGEVYTLVLTFFGNVVTTITSNPLLYVPILISLAGGLMMFAVGVIRRMGLKGVGAGRRRRRR